MTPVSNEARSPEERVLALLGGQVVAQALASAARLGIPDRLGDGRTVTGLASELDCDPDMLGRLMQVLVAEEVFEVDEEARYRCTPIGEALGRQRLGVFAEFMGSPAQWAPWARLADAVRTGVSAFALHHGQELYPWMAEHPEEAARYDAAIDRFTIEQARALAEAWDFGEGGPVVDVGAGRGTLALELLHRWPELDLILFDVDHVLEGARSRLAEAGRARQCRFVPGSFFEALPEGAETYLLKHILHNWSDEDAVRILRGVAAAGGPGAQILVIEGILMPEGYRSSTRFMDLEMMMLFGRGRERTKAEFRALFAEAGLRMHRTTTPLGHFARLMVVQSAG